MARLETGRLILRSPELGDAAAIAAALNDFDISKNLAVVPFPYTENDAYAFIARAADALGKGEAWCFVIRRKTDNALIGACGLHLKEGGYELGYWIAKPHWRQGYATEAAHELAAFAFHDLKAENLRAGWYHDNGISGRILAGLGFKAEGVVKQDCLARGHAVLCNRTMLTRADFGRKKPLEARSRHAEEPGVPSGPPVFAS
jgi:[ribosomal protein S5]-alanine N-acetyltransferase